MFQLIQPYCKGALLKLIGSSFIYLFFLIFSLLYLARDIILPYFSFLNLYPNSTSFLFLISFFIVCFPLGLFYFFFYYDKVTLDKIYLKTEANDFDGYDYHHGIQRNSFKSANTIKEKFLLLLLDTLKIFIVLFIYLFVIVLIFSIFFGVTLLTKT